MTAAQLQLVTAAVDGELSADQNGDLRTLLASSPEAQRLFAKLEADRVRLLALPQVAPPTDLHARIMAQIAVVAPAPNVKSARPGPLPEPVIVPLVRTRPVRRSAWLPVAVAAGLLVSVTLGSFAFFRNTAAPQPFAQSHWSNALPAPHDVRNSVPSPVVGAVDRNEPGVVVRGGVSPVPPAPTPHELPPIAVVTAPLPRTVTSDLIGFPVLPKLPPFERIEVKVPFLRSVADLGREDVSNELLDAIGREDSDVTPVRFDLFVRDPARGVEMFQHAARASGATVHADAATLDRLKKKQLHSAVVYTECLTAKELAALFAKVAAEDAKYSPRVGDSLHASAVVRSDELELKTVLGLDVGLYKRAAGNGSHGSGGADRVVPPGKAVSANTLDQVVQSVSGTNPPSPAKAPEKPMVLLTWQTTHPGILRTNPLQSAELKQYLQKRGTRKATAVPAIVVIRPAG